MVMIRNLMDRGLLNTSHGQVAVGWLVLEDLIAVLILVLLPALVTNTHELLWQTAGPVESRGVCSADVSRWNARHSLVSTADGAPVVAGTLHCRNCRDHGRDGDWRIVCLWCFPGARCLPGRSRGERIGVQPPVWG